MTANSVSEKERHAGQTDAATSIFLLHGEDELALGEAAHALIDRLCPRKERAFGLEVFDGACAKTEEATEILRQVTEALCTASFLGGQKTVWLRDAAFLDTGTLSKTERVKTAVVRLADLLKQGLPPGRHFVVSAQKVFKSSAFYKACQAGGRVDYFGLSDKPYERIREMPERIKAFCRERDLRMDDSMIKYLLTRCAPDPRQLQQECEKLSLFLGPGGRVTRDAVDLMVSASVEAMHWDLTEAVGDRDMARALRLARDLTAKESACVYLVMMLERYLRDLMVLKECVRQRWLVIEAGPYGKTIWTSDPEAGALLDAIYASAPRQDPRKKHPYPLRLMAEKSARFSRRELRLALAHTVAAHEAMVSSSLSPRLQLELLLLRITPPATRVARRA